MNKADFLKSWRFLSLRSEEGKTFWRLGTLYLLYVIPILLAGDAYIDDLGRSIYGYLGGTNNGRPFADMVMMAVNFGKNLQDTAPLSQLLAIGLLAYTMVLLSRRWYAPLPGTLLVPCLGLAILPPFLLENLSYHFDAVTMMLALCLGLSCYALPEEWSRRGRFLYGVAATFLVLGLYQAAIGAYLSMVFVEIVCTRGGGIWRRMAERFGALLLAGALYKVMCSFVVHLDDYSGAHAQMVFPMTQEGIGIFLRNLASFGGWFGLAIASTSRVTFVVVLALLLYGLWHFHQEKRDMCYLIALAGMLIGIVLPQLFLREPVFAARVLISCVVLAIFLGMLLSRAIQQKRAAALLLLPLLLSGFAGAYAYGNVLHAQSDCNRRVAQQIVSDIGQMDPGAARNDIVIFGQAPSAREREHAKAKRPIIVAMTPIYMNGDWMWGGILMNHLSARDFHVIKAQEDDQAWMKAAQPCLTRDMYRIYLRDDCWIVDFAPEKRL